MIRQLCVDSPIGKLRLRANEDNRLCGLELIAPAKLPAVNGDRLPNFSPDTPDRTAWHPAPFPLELANSPKTDRVKLLLDLPEQSSSHTDNQPLQPIFQLMDAEASSDNQLANGSDILPIAAEQLSQYFAGQRRDFSLSCEMVGTVFQCQTWYALTQLRFGQLASYGQLANWVGRPKAARAVGQAVNKNSLAIVLGCHRVVGSMGRLVGYAYGLAPKLWLLNHETANFALKASGK